MAITGSRWLARTALLAALLASACRDDTLTNADGKDPDDPTGYNADWTEASHGARTVNYGTVFPQNSVNTIEISMTAAQWQSVRDNMRALWGFDFGQQGMGGPGGFPAVEPNYIDVSVKFNGKTWKNVGYRLKGNSSLSSAWRQGNYKLPFRLNFDEFEQQYPAIRNQHFWGFKELSFSPGFADNSLIREKVTADIFRMAGIPSARTAFYRVYIDYGAGLKYCGVYTVVELPDDYMVKDQFGEDSGNLYKPESRFQTFVVAQFEKKNNELAADYADVQAFIAALNNPIRTSNPAQWRASLEAVFNVDHFIRWSAVNNAMVNWDTYGAIAHNYYLYNHSVNKLTWIPWDHNQSMSGNPGITGTATPGTPVGPNRGLSLTMNEVSAQWPLLRYLADDPVYFARYKAYMKEFVATVFTPANIDALFDKYHGLIAPYVTGAQGEQPGYTFLVNAGAFSTALNDLKNHVRNRRTLVTTFTQ